MARVCSVSQVDDTLKARFLMHVLGGQVVPKGTPGAAVVEPTLDAAGQLQYRDGKLVCRPVSRATRRAIAKDVRRRHGRAKIDPEAIGKFLAERKMLEDAIQLRLERQAREELALLERAKMLSEQHAVLGQFLAEQAR